MIYRGMYLSDLNATLDVMRTIYPFKDDKTRIVDFQDLQDSKGVWRRVEIITTDEKTGIQITMAKGVDKVDD